MSLSIFRHAQRRAPHQMRILSSGPMNVPHAQSDEKKQVPCTTQRRTIATDAAMAVARLGELREVGLGAATPVGVMQNIVEFNSAMTGLPWVGGIVLTTLALRTLTLPLILGSMRNNYTLMNIQPEMQMHMQRIKQCQSSNDHAGAQAATENLSALFKEHNVHPFKGFIPILFQAPVFISMFMGLRKMAELPVEGLKNGGALWFPDLTASDPYFVLPVFASITMLLTIELGADGVKQQNKTMKNVFRFLSVGMLPVTLYFPTAVFVYWCTSNSFSLAQTAVLKIPAVRKFVNIPDMVERPATSGDKADVKGDLLSGIRAARDNLTKQKEKASLTAINKPRIDEFASPSSVKAPSRGKKAKRK